MIDGAVVMRVYGRASVEFPLPLSVVKEWVHEAGADRLVESEWHQALFLCRDRIVASFAGNVQGKPRVLFTHLPATADRLQALPGLYELWVWKSLGKTWDDVHRSRRGLPEATKSMS